MDFLEVVRKRKSIRRFQSKEIEEEKIKKILEIVRQAPSAGNLQAYKIFVVKSKTAKKRFLSTSFGQQWIKEAAVLLIFCTDIKLSSQRYGTRGAQLYALQDASIAASYAQLAITDLGFGSVWIGSFNEEKIKKVLETDLMPIAILAIGHPAEDPIRPEKKTVEEIGEIL